MVAKNAGKSKAKPFVFFKLRDKSKVTLALRLTNGNNSATSLFRLTDISDSTKHQLLGATKEQNDRAAFEVPAANIVAPGRTTMVLDWLPVAQAKDDVTLSIVATQSGVALLAFDVNGKRLDPGPNGISVYSVAMGTPSHCGIYLNAGA